MSDSITDSDRYEISNVVMKHITDDSKRFVADVCDVIMSGAEQMAPNHKWMLSVVTSLAKCECVSVVDNAFLLRAFSDAFTDRYVRRTGRNILNIDEEYPKWHCEIAREFARSCVSQAVADIDLVFSDNDDWGDRYMDGVQDTLSE